MNVLTTTPSHFGDVAVARPGPRDRKTGAFNPVEYRTTYLNNLPCPVTIGYRSGLKFTLPPLRDMGPSKLIVRTEIIIHPSMRGEIQRILSAVTDSASNELKALREAFAFNILENTYGGATLILDYPLTLEQLQSYSGSIYYHELDSVISLNSQEKTPPHPYSEEGRDLRLIDASEADLSDIGFGYSVELIDNSKTYGDRYLNIGNKVYKVVAQRDAERRDGIYVIANHPVTGELGRDGREVKHYSFEGAEDKLGIFRTAEEALNLGDAALARKQELVAMEHALQIQKVELQAVKNEHAREMLEKEKELKAVEIERDRQARLIKENQEAQEHAMKMERERAKDYYEHRSYDRKDSHEVLKFLPSIIVGIGAIFMAIEKFRPK